jgi:signal transduction histidine kinase
VQLEDDTGFIVQIAASRDEVEEESRRLGLLLLALVPAALLISGGAALVIIRAGFRPITTMVESAGRITAANLDQRIALPETRDEIRLLADTLNAMIARIGDSFRSQRQFIADASHEIRTPLTIIRTELEFGERSGDAEEMREIIGIAIGEVDQLASLAGSLLLLVRLDSPHNPLAMQPARLDEIVMRAVNRMSAIAGRKGITLAPHIAEAIEIRGDGEKLERAIINLLDNAIKYSHGGGSVTVSLAREGARGRIAVEDSGIGVSPGELPHIFERFHRAGSTRATGEGHGLGLAIVGRIVELHGGSVTARSVEGEGTTIVIELPIECPA